MKNKIIALFLVVVMATLALASCTKPYNYAEENLGDYLQILEGFEAKLTQIEIEDGSFTTNEETRQKKVTAAIYSALASYAEKNGEKKTDGTIDMDDTLYYAYYITYEKDGVVYAYDVDTYMAETASPKNSVKLSAIDVDDEKADKLAVAIKKAINALEDKTIDGYKTNTTKNTAVTKEAFKSVFVSYTRTTGEGEAKKVSVANAEKINLHAEGDTLEAKLAAILTDPVNKDKVAIYDSTKQNYVEVAKPKENETDTTVFSKTFSVTDGETTYEYSNFKILFAVESEGAGITVEQTLTADKSLKTTDIDSIHAEADSVTIPKDATVTYHIYPVYYYAVSEVGARSIILEALAEKITATSLEIFADEGYKSGDKTLKALVEELVEVYKENTSTKIKELKTAYDKAEATVTSAKEKLDAANKAVTDAGDAATEEQKKAQTDAQSTYDKAVTDRDDAKTKYETAKNAAANKVDEILKVTKEGDEDGIAKAIVNEYREDQYHTMKESYDQEILDKAAAALWDIIDKNVVLKSGSYPSELVKEAKDHLYNQYEYKFYTQNNETTGNSIYSEFGGDFDAYIIKESGAADINGVDAKIEEKAKGYILPIMKIYVVAKALEAKAVAAMPAQIEENKFAYLESDGSEGVALEITRYLASNFYLDNDAFEGYKEIVGKKDFENSQEYYGGETNIRAAMQFSNLFDYLLMTRREETGEGDDKHVEVKYNADGKLDFYNITYKLKGETADAE